MVTVTGGPGDNPGPLLDLEWTESNCLCVVTSTSKVSEDHDEE